MSQPGESTIVSMSPSVADKPNVRRILDAEQSALFDDPAGQTYAQALQASGSVAETIMIQNARRQQLAAEFAAANPDAALRESELLHLSFTRHAEVVRSGIPASPFEA